MLELNIKELNDLYYCLGKVMMLDCKMIEDNNIEELMNKIRDEIVRQN